MFGTETINKGELLGMLLGKLAKILANPWIAGANNNQLQFVADKAIKNRNKIPKTFLFGKATYHTKHRHVRLRRQAGFALQGLLTFCLATHIIRVEVGRNIGVGHRIPLTIITAI